MKRLSSWVITLQQVAVPQTNSFFPCVSQCPAIFWAVASEKVLWRVLPLHLSLSVLLGVKVAWIVHMSRPYKSSSQKTTHHVAAVGVFQVSRLTGEQTSNSRGSWWVRLPSCFIALHQRPGIPKLHSQVHSTQQGRCQSLSALNLNEICDANLPALLWDFYGFLRRVLHKISGSAHQRQRFIQMFWGKGAMRAICQVQKRVLGRGDLNSATALVIMNHGGHLRSSWVIFNFGVTHPYISAPHLCNVICICIYPYYMLRILRSLIYSACMYFKLNVCLEKRSLSSTSFKKSNSGPKSICSRAGREPQSKNEISVTKAGGKVRWKSFDLQVRFNMSLLILSEVRIRDARVEDRPSGKALGAPRQWTSSDGLRDLLRCEAKTYGFTQQLWPQW